MNVKENFKGFVFFWKGMKAAKKEMWVSVQVLFVITLVLTIVLYFIEHAAQPDSWTNLWDSIVWGFMSYLGNPGKFSPGEPVTLIGRFIAIIISVIKILIFAVPAGLVANGFRAAMAEDKAAKKNKENVDKIKQSIYTHCSLLNNVRFWPKKLYRFNEIKMNIDLSENDIIDAVRSTSELRVRDLALFLKNTNGVKPEMLAVELQHTNTSYGFCNAYPYDDYPEVKSNITVVCPVAATEAALNYYAYQMARVGHFNVVINNFLSSNADNSENRCIIAGIHDYQYNDAENYPKLHQYVDDLKRTIIGKDSWVFVLNAAPSPKEDAKKQKIRLWVDVAEENDENTLNDCTSVDDKEKLQAFYDELCEKMSSAHGIEPTIKYTKSKATRQQRYIREKMCVEKPNVIEIGLTNDYRVFGTDVKAQYGVIKTLADIIHAHFETKETDWNMENWTSDDVRKNRSKLIPSHKGEQ